MPFETGISNSAAFLAIGSLLILSLWTVQQCRRDKSRPRQEAVFLFGGKTFLHSIASSVGAIFSVTYFLGAPMIYTKVYGYWLLVIMVLVALISIILLFSILKKFESTVLIKKRNLRTTNAMLQYMENHCNKKQFQTYNLSLMVIYGALLIEELSISRLVLEQIFASNEMIATIILCIIVFVAYSYIYIGGFKAVLNSDKLQTLVLFIFIIVLVFLSFNSSENQLILQKNINLEEWWLIASIGFWSIFGIAWIIGSVDFYSSPPCQYK